MSKKEKKKVIVKLLPGEAVFVADINVLEHIASTYSHMAKQCENKYDAESWMDVSNRIVEWLSKTYNSGSPDGLEEEW